jgi:hypothetical protein
MVRMTNSFLEEWLTLARDPNGFRRVSGLDALLGAAWGRSALPLRKRHSEETANIDSHDGSNFLSRE